MPEGLVRPAFGIFIYIMITKKKSVTQFAEIIEDINKRKSSAIKNKCSPSYIVVSKEMYLNLKRIIQKNLIFDI